MFSALQLVDAFTIGSAEAAGESGAASAALFMCGVFVGAGLAGSAARLRRAEKSGGKYDCENSKHPSHFFLQVCTELSLGDRSEARFPSCPSFFDGAKRRSGNKKERDHHGHAQGQRRMKRLNKVVIEVGFEGFFATVQFALRIAHGFVEFRPKAKKLFSILVKLPQVLQVEAFQFSREFVQGSYEVF